MMELYESQRDALGKVLAEHCFGYRYLREQGFQEDLDFCLQIDRYAVVPRFTGGMVSAGKA
jgi:phosphosulfolactate phosphohydrolase-like enzyme